MNDHQNDATDGRPRDAAVTAVEQTIIDVLSEHTADYRIAPDDSDHDVVVVCDGQDCEHWVGADSHEHAEHTTGILIAALTAAGVTIVE
ncbi:hypothetical protein [Prescottella subtropica]|uniref:hypothetical protein n=1 Tax=Prescottella subtropica TaxID=2545757 RepID=UPI0010F51F34|nr:hypothetical protein [Prescottella subtropica]